MKEDLTFHNYYKYIIICSLAYCIPVFWFFENERFRNAWLFYLGSFLFEAAVLLSAVLVSKKYGSDNRPRTLLNSGFKIMLFSIILNCVVVLGLGLIFKNNVLVRSPVNIGGLHMFLAVSATLINFFAAAFGVFLGYVTFREYEKNEKGEDVT
ncbi:MAG TPA: hypothetical protein VMH01_09060 [Puia sp.]|nr:hypothetical protein [Puia sp.]